MHEQDVTQNQFLNEIKSFELRIFFHQDLLLS